MAKKLLNILVAGDPVLRKVAEPVTRIDKKLHRLLKDMADTMYASDGVGLAAPQIGVSKRIVVIDVGEGLFELINPIYWSRGSLDNELQVKFENCLLRTPQPSTSDITMFSDCIFEDVKDTLTTGPNSFILFDTHNFFYDFTPKEGSQAIGAAIPDPNIPIDRKGKTRHTQKPDMGCYETDKE